MSKTPLRKNYTLLALAIIYAIIATIQVFAPGILAIRLYFSVAFISLSTTLCEFLKSCVNWIRTIEATATTMAIDGTKIIGKDIELIKQHPSLSELKEQLQTEYDDLSRRLEPKKETSRDKRLKMIDSIIPFVEIFDILLFVIITPLKIIPNDLLTNKVINIISLLSVALAFLSIYMNDAASSSLEYYKEKCHIYCQISNFYLDIIKKVSEDSLVCESRDNQNDND